MGASSPGRRVLHLLSQRPALTGSGVTMDALVRRGAAAGWDQHAVVGVPLDGGATVGELPDDRVYPLRFGGADLPFPVPGMSDVMPYASTRFSSMDAAARDRYRSAWSRHLTEVAERARPDLVHAHHLWAMGALVKDVFPDTPVVSHCHATGLRQMELCPDRAPAIRAGLRRNDAFVVLHEEHAEAVRRTLDVVPDRVHVVGAGYADDVFHAAGRDAETGSLLFAGKLAPAKGLPWLLDSFEALRRRRPDAVLHVAGGGEGPEAEALRSRIDSTAGARLHGRLDQGALAALMRRCRVFVLPSLYEGLPLVLVEAAACGCRLVATGLPGVRTELAPRLAPAIELIPPPRTASVDRPLEADLPAFTARLEAALGRALDAGDAGPVPGLDSFTWDAVFRRVESVWRQTQATATSRSASAS